MTRRETGWPHAAPRDPVPAPPPAWAHLDFFRDDWPDLAARLGADKRPHLPSRADWFRALTMVPPDALRVVILGQDPYPTPGNADGLAFSVRKGQKLPASLRNILQELADDTGDRRADGDLTGWARQGVLLLNTALTVPAGTAGGHARLGWHRLAAAVLADVSHSACAFVLWGNHAQAMAAHIRPGDHLVVASAHPSPLSARRGFFGSRPFSRINTWLTMRGAAAIDWSA